MVLWRVKQNDKECFGKSTGCTSGGMTVYHIIEAVLFAHRISRHSSTKYSPLFLIYNRDPVLPIDIKCSLAKREVNETEVFD